MDDNELPKKILWTNRGVPRRRGRPKTKWIDGLEEDVRKLGCRTMHRVQVAGDICLRRPMPTESCRVEDDDDDEIPIVSIFHTLYRFGLKGGAYSRSLSLLALPR
jgi:hypothetical protein